MRGRFWSVAAAEGDISGATGVSAFALFSEELPRAGVLAAAVAVAVAVAAAATEAEGAVVAPALSPGSS